MNRTRRKSFMLLFLFQVLLVKRCVQLSETVRTAVKWSMNSDTRLGINETVRIVFHLRLLPCVSSLQLRVGPSLIKRRIKKTLENSQPKRALNQFFIAFWFTGPASSFCQSRLSRLLNINLIVNFGKERFEEYPGLGYCIQAKERRWIRFEEWKNWTKQP